MRKKWAIMVKMTDQSEWSRMGSAYPTIERVANAAADYLAMMTKMGSDPAIRIISVEA